jgi:DNA invertase Pin-like site-specific DNA recombinase
MTLIGYARVSTQDQNLGGQIEVLRAAGCTRVFEEKASGGSRARPQLAEALMAIQPGDTFVVVKIDRLARSLTHLLDVIEQLTSYGASFCSLSDPIDTSSSTGRLTLQLLGAVAEFERSLIRERTVAGLKYTKSQGTELGNPRIKARNPVTLAKIQAGRHRTHLGKVTQTADEWLPIVRQLRPEKAWPVVLDAINDALPHGRQAFTEERLVRAVKLLVTEGMAEPVLLQAAQKRRSRKHDVNRTVAVQAAAALYVGRGGKITLAELGSELVRLQHFPVQGSGKWAPASVKALLDKGRKLGLIQEINRG